MGELSPLSHPVAGRAASLTSVELLGLALFHEPRPAAPFMVMTAYLDESGTHGHDSPAVIMACFIARQEQWAAYERALGALFSEFGVEVFHAKKFRTRSGEFKGWTREKQAAFNSRFIQIADDNIPYGFCSMLPSRNYRDIYLEKPLPRRARPDTQYGLCFRFCLFQALLAVKDKVTDWPLALILENGHRNAPDAHRIHKQVSDALIPKYQPMLSGITFMPRAVAFHWP
jgi:hypothetical protein